MRVQLNRYNTRVFLTDEPWNRGIQRFVVERREIPFLLPALSGHHFFTGVWPPPPNAIDYEPHESRAKLTQPSEFQAVYHQPPSPYTCVEMRIAYEIVDVGVVTVRFDTQSHADSYPHGYVGLFFGTMPLLGGQRGMHLLCKSEDGLAHWHYFQGGGDSWTPRANTVLGPRMPSAAHSANHPPTYFFAESTRRFALPVQVLRWQDMYCSFEFDNADVAFTNVLLGTAIGGASQDVYWRLQPGESKTICCRFTVGTWKGWEDVTQRYRTWHGSISTPDVALTSNESWQPFAKPDHAEPVAESGLALSRKLFNEYGKQLLERLNLLNRCTVGCFGGMSQNAGLDDAISRDHMWGPYLTFLLRDDDWERQHQQLELAIQEFPDEAGGGVRWIGYGGMRPRKTAACPIGLFLKGLTGFEARPETDSDWLPHLTGESFLGRRWTEQLFDAGQGQVFHDPGKQFTEVWRHWTAYVPPDIHRALLARSLFRVWNAGPEYNLTRLHQRADRLAFNLCLARFVNEVIELAFGWNERFVPSFKWRPAHFRRLPICPTAIREGIEALSDASHAESCLTTAISVIKAIKLLMRDLYHVTMPLHEPLSAFARAVRAAIEDEDVKRHTVLDW